jgi:hypothetical protein
VIAFAVAPAPVTRDGARDAARHELSKAIYHRYDDPLPVRVVKAVLHWLGHVLSVAADHSPGGPAGAVTLVVLAIALVAIARWRLGPMRRNVTRSHVVLDRVVRTAADHRRHAELAAQQGRWSEAVIERMRAVARRLEELDVVAPRPGRTADELAAESAEQLVSAAVPLRRAAAVFDEVAYGGRTGSAETYAVIVGADDAVHERRHSLVGRA